MTAHCNLPQGMCTDQHAMLLVEHSQEHTIIECKRHGWLKGGPLKFYNRDKLGIAIEGVKCPAALFEGE